jgi:hypothetical protein
MATVRRPSQAMFGTGPTTRCAWVNIHADSMRRRRRLAAVVLYWQVRAKRRKQCHFLEIQR